MSSSSVIYYPAPERPFTRSETTAIVGKALESNPKLAQALRQVLAERLAAATSDVAQIVQTAEIRAHAAGRIAEINALQAEIGSYLAAASKETAATTGRSR